MGMPDRKLIFVILQLFLQRIGPIRSPAIHVGLTMIAALLLVVIDGLQHPSFLIAYMCIGWVIPLALWRFVAKRLS